MPLVERIEHISSYQVSKLMNFIFDFTDTKAITMIMANDEEKGRVPSAEMAQLQSNVKTATAIPEKEKLLQSDQSPSKKPYTELSKVCFLFSKVGIGIQ
ncbi:unnamed protein product [Enterobius vermicularis]|uniref:Ovule protein n=1 Tax=Enterobius vermicularis TaxID=51028 RepID=A0A0N4VPT0_ENTVE|nr:unnamed protein product [Enterobius vermicularis]